MLLSDDNLLQILDELNDVQLPVIRLVNQQWNICIISKRSLTIKCIKHQSDVDLWIKKLIQMDHIELILWLIDASMKVRSFLKQNMNLLIPIFEHLNDFDKIMDFYASINSSNEKIESDSTKKWSRFFHVTTTLKNPSSKVIIKNQPTIDALVKIIKDCGNLGQNVFKSLMNFGQWDILIQLIHDCPSFVESIKRLLTDDYCAKEENNIIDFDSLMKFHQVYELIHDCKKHCSPESFEIEHLLKIIRFKDIRLIKYCMNHYSSISPTSD